VAAATGYIGALTIAYVTTRYLADLLPFLALGAIAGLQVLLARGTSARVLLAGAGALALVGLVTNAATGLVDQRLVNPLSSEPDRAAFVKAQDDVDRFLGRRAAGVRSSDRLPATAPGRAGDLLVLGRCDGLYAASSFGRWLSVERTPATGYHVLRLRDPTALGARPRVLLTDGAVTVTARRARGSVVFGLAVGAQAERESRPVALPRDATVVVSFEEAGPASPVFVRVGGRNVVGVIAPYRPGSPYRVEGDVAQALPVAAPVCAAVAGRARLRGAS
jgi:hypothetical protein